MAVESWVQEPLRRAFGDVRVVDGFSSSAKHAAQGAALIAEGLAGGEARLLVDTLGLRHARGTVLDYLHVIDMADHYSQLANYMRLNGMLPPTALPRPPRAN